MSQKKVTGKTPTKNATGRHPGGRPSKYTPELADIIINSLLRANGLVVSCETAGIDITTFYRWMDDHAELRNRYARAKDMLADILADEVLDVSRDGRLDFGFIETQDDSGESAKPVFNAVHVQRSKLIADALKWRAAKLAPKKYGEKLDVGLSAPDGGPIQTELTVRFVKPVSTDLSGAARKSE